MNVYRIVALSLCLLLLSGCESRAKKDFIKGCESTGGADSSQCSCTFDNLQKHYGKDTLNRMAEAGSDMSLIRQSTPDDFPEQVAQAAYMCGAKGE